MSWSDAIVRSSRQKPEVLLAQAISRFEANLSDEDFRTCYFKSLLSVPTFHDVMQLTAKLDSQMLQNGGDQCYGHRFIKFLQCVQQFAALDHEMNIHALDIWSVVCMSLDSMVTSSYIDALSIHFLEIGRSAPRYDNLALLYSRSKSLRSQMLEYFVLVVNFCHRLQSFTQKSTIPRLSFTLNDLDLGSFRADLKRCARSIEMEVNYIKAQEAFTSGPLSTKLSSAYHCQKIESKQEVLDICSKYDHYTTWRQTWNSGYTPMSEWLAGYGEWRFRSSSCTLVCTGKPYSGKSVLLANIVDDLKNHVEQDHAVVAYFFCRQDVPESLKVRTILGSLVRQLLQPQVDLSMVFKLCEETESIENEKILEVLFRGFSSDRKAYFVLDGLDACNRSEKETLAQYLQRIQKRLPLLLCTSFRIEPNKALEPITRLFTNTQITTIPDNNPEFEKFIKADLERCLSNGRLVVGDPTLIRSIRDALLKESQGMFVLAVLQIRYLCGLSTDQTRRHALVDLPNAVLAALALTELPYELSECLSWILYREKEPIPSSQRQIADSVTNDSTSKSLPQSSIFAEESQQTGAFASTIPTSQCMSKLEAENQTGNPADLDWQESNTIYSIDSTPENLEYVLLFAHRLIEDLKDESGLLDLSDIPSSFVNDALGAFTWRLYEEGTNPFQWETSVILHRKRNKIASILIGNELDQEASSIETIEEKDSGGESRPPFVKSHDYLFTWIDGVSALNDDEAQQPPESSNIGEPYLFQVADYQKFIHQSEAYRWLLSKICQYGRLSFGTPNMMARIGDRIMSRLQAQAPLRTMSRRRALSLVNITFHLEWNPKTYIMDLGFDSPPSNILDKVICLTGAWCEAQALTVSEYIHQTWPVTGSYIVSTLQQLIAIPEGQEHIYILPGTKGTHISARLESKDLCTISVTAGPYFVSEFSEQIAWLAAALQPPPKNEGVVSCRPLIKHLSFHAPAHEDPTGITTGLCSFSFEYELESIYSRPKSGFCWSSLFGSPILITGFPILRRPEPGTGLEMSLGTMACLIHADKVVQCGERIMMKGFSSLLIATFAAKSVVLWHLFGNGSPGERISYFDDRIDMLDSTEPDIPSLRVLESSRHIVGWCAKATDFCGHATANCTITASGLRPSPSSIVIDRMYIEGGMNLIGGINLCPNRKEQPIKLHRERDYPELLQMVAAHPVAFYDVADRRSWLVDGASALLYLVRISLHLDATDPESTFDWVFDNTKLQDTWDGCNGRVAALKTLKSWKHRNIPVYVKGQSTRDGQVVEEFSTFGDRVDKILHWLEILIDRDVYLASRDGIKVSQTLDRRKSISGFDLLDLIKPLGPIGTRTAPMDSWGDGWVDLFPSIGVTTIFGKGFGDLIRPDEPSQVCADWKSVPLGFDYLATSLSTLKMIEEKRLRRLTPKLGSGELTNDILWTSLCHPFKPCGCIDGNAMGKKKHLDPVQYLVSKKSWNPSRKPKGTNLIDMGTLDEAGAVLFANLSLFGRRIDAKSTTDRATKREVNEVSLTAPSSSSRTTSPSVTDIAMTQSANSTNITTPSAGSVEDNNQQDNSGRRKGKGRVESFQRKWNRLMKKGG